MSLPEGRDPGTFCPAALLQNADFASEWNANPKTEARFGGVIVHSAIYARLGVPRGLRFLRAEVQFRDRPMGLSYSSIVHRAATGSTATINGNLIGSTPQARRAKDSSALVMCAQNVDSRNLFSEEGIRARAPITAIPFAAEIVE